MACVMVPGLDEEAGDRLLGEHLHALLLQREHRAGDLRPAEAGDQVLADREIRIEAERGASPERRRCACGCTASPRLVRRSPPARCSPRCRRRSAAVRARPIPRRPSARRSRLPPTPNSTSSNTEPKRPAADTEEILAVVLEVAVAGGAASSSAAPRTSCSAMPSSVSASPSRIERTTPSRMTTTRVQLSTKSASRWVTRMTVAAGVGDLAHLAEQLVRLFRGSAPNWARRTGRCGRRGRARGQFRCAAGWRASNRRAARRRDGRSTARPSARDRRRRASGDRVDVPSRPASMFSPTVRLGNSCGS